MAFRDQRGQPERGKNEKKGRVISPHPASFLFKHKLCLSGLALPFSLFLYYPPRLNLPPLLPIPFPFSLSSQLASSHLQSHLLYLLQQGGKTHPRLSPPSRKYLQFQGKSVLKHGGREGILLISTCVLVHSLDQRDHVFVLMSTCSRPGNSSAANDKRLASVCENRSGL